MFTGFSRDTASFFEGLEADNSREYFTTHRDEYERLIRQPLEDLLGEAEPRYGTGKLMRPNRDVRFSPDKTPYRLNASMWAGEVGAVYLTLSAKGIEAGGGLYDPSRDQLERARQAIDSVPLAASQLTEIFARLEASQFEVAGPSLKTAPRGYEKDHPAIALLRLKHFAVTRRLAVDAPAAEVWRIWEQVQPLLDWGAEHVGKALNWP